jgi:hypothetical protein
VVTRASGLDVDSSRASDSASGNSISDAAGAPPPDQVIVVSSVMFTFISYWRTAWSCCAAWPAASTSGPSSGGDRARRPLVHPRRDAVQLRRRSICQAAHVRAVYQVVKAMGGLLASSPSPAMFIRHSPTDQHGLRRAVHHRPVAGRTARSTAPPGLPTRRRHPRWAPWSSLA